jgi:hypothetical protein
METRLALDTTRVTFEFDGHDERDRERMAYLYRVARVFSHVATDGRVTIEAELPRRMLERFRKDAVAR